MMKIKQLMFSAILVFGAVFSTTYSHAQAFEEGTSAATLGYGVPNLAGAWMKLWTIDNPDATRSAFGPMHLKYEYGITDKLGIGVSINTATAKLNNEYTESEWNSSTSTYSEVTRTETIKFSSFNVLARLNWHWIDHDKVDFYSGFGIGYNKNSFKYENTDPEYDIDSEVESLNQLYNIIPLGYEATLGLRYYFTDNIGAYLEAGYAKSLLQFGVAARF